MGATNKGGEILGLNNGSETTRRTLLAGLLGLGATSVTACFGGGKTDTTPGPAPTVAGEATPGVTNPPIPETTTPTPETPSVVEPLREWNVPADTLQRLQEATSSEDRRVILNELIKAHDPEYRPSVVDGKQFFEGSAERLFDGIARQIRIIGELGCDPNTQKIGGLEIAKVWAEEVFADRQYGQQFIEQVEHWLYALSDSDPQEAQAMRNVFREEFGPFDYELLVSTKQATGFHNEVTGKDFHGITAVAVTRQYDGKKPSNAQVLGLSLSFVQNPDLSQGYQIEGYYDHSNRGSNFTMNLEPGSNPVELGEVIDRFWRPGDRRH